MNWVEAAGNAHFVLTAALVSFRAAAESRECALRRLVARMLPAVPSPGCQSALAKPKVRPFHLLQTKRGSCLGQQPVPYSKRSRGHTRPVSSAIKSLSGGRKWMRHCWDGCWTMSRPTTQFSRATARSPTAHLPVWVFRHVRLDSKGMSLRRTVLGPVAPRNSFHDARAAELGRSTRNQATSPCLIKSERCPRALSSRESCHNERHNIKSFLSISSTRR